MNNNNRIFGLEALRLLTMLMVVTLHVLMRGIGIKKSVVVKL